MLLATYTLSILIMLAAPVVLGIFLARRLGTRWRLFGAGALTFVASQVVRLPLLFVLTALFSASVLPAPPARWLMIFNVGILSISAGIFEEGARYLAFRFWVKDARTWRQALKFGAGHGGIESIITGLLVALTLINMAVLRNMDVSTLPLTPAQATALSDQVTQFWAVTWPMTLMGGLERLFAISLHLSLSVMVLQAVLRRNMLWLLTAIVWHAAANMAGVFALQRWGPYGAEAVIGAFAVASLAAMFALRRVMPDAPAASSASASATAPMPPAIAEGEAPITSRQVDESRYL
jgi:uncharacterized membrane protein YhfC